MAAARVGAWDWDLSPDGVTWTPTLEDLFGLAPGEFSGAMDDFIARVHPDDREVLSTAIDAALAERVPLDADHRVVWPDGTVRWLHARGEAVIDDAGVVVGMRGIAFDVTEQRAIAASLAGRSRQQAAVVDLGRRALDGTPFPKLLDFAARSVAEALDVDIAAIVEAPERGEPAIRAPVGWPASIPAPTPPVDWKAGPGAVAALSGSAVWPPLPQAGIRSSLHTEIGDGGGRWGLLAVYSKSERTFSDDDANFILAIAQLLSTTMRRQELEAQQRFLAEASEAMSRSLGYESTVETVARWAVPLLGDWCSIHLVDVEDDALLPYEVAHVLPEKAELSRSIRARWPVDIASDRRVAQVLRSGVPDLAAEVTDAHYEAASQDAEHLDALRRLGIRSGLIMPLRARGRTIGALMLGISESRRRYEPSDIPFAERYASRAALEIDNTRFYREAEQRAEQREELISVASHELRSPLTSIIGFSARLARRAETPGAFDEATGREIGILHEQAIRMRNTVEVFLDLTRLQSGEFTLDLELVDLGELVASEAAALAARYPDARVEMTTSQPAVIETDELRVRQIVRSLLDNAVRHGGDSPEVRITIEPDTTRAIIQVADNGPGVPEERRPLIFQRRLGAGAPSSGRPRGMGLGLYVANGIAHRLEGRLAFTTSDEGSEFSLSLPLALGRASATGGADRQQPATYP